MQERIRWGPLSHGAHFQEMVAGGLMFQQQRVQGKSGNAWTSEGNLLGSWFWLIGINFDKRFSSHQYPRWACSSVSHWCASYRKGYINCSCQEGKQYVAPRTELVPDFVIWVLFHVQKARSSWSWGDYLLCDMDVLLPRVWIEFPPKTMSDQAYAPGPVSSRITDGSPYYSHAQISPQYGIPSSRKWHRHTKYDLTHYQGASFLPQILVDNAACYCFSIFWTQQSLVH